MFIIGRITGNLLDPIAFLIAFIVVLFSRSKWIILVAAIAETVLSEAIVTSTQVTRDFGDGLAVGFVAALIHATVAYLIVTKFRNRKSKQSETASEET